MQRLTCTGVVTAPPEFTPDTLSGDLLRFHVNLDMGATNHVWLACTMRGKRATKAHQDLLSQDRVTVIGSIDGIGDSLDGPIFTNVAELIIHAPPTD